MLVKSSILARTLTQQRAATFTRSFRKIVLTQDVEQLGFAGETCFVKPGFAMNYLVPNNFALFTSDARCDAYLKDVNAGELQKKQEVRKL